MALQWTYTTLFAALQDWPVEQDNEDYDDNLPNLIGMGELRVVRDLNLSIFDVIDESLTVDEGERFITKPTGLVVVRSLRLGQVISTQVEQPADDDAISVAQVAPNVEAALSITGAAAVLGVVTYTVAREISVTETLHSAGGIEVIVTGTDQNGAAIVETITTLKNGQIAYSLNLFLTITAVSARFGDGTRQVKVGGAVARGGVVLGETWPLELRSKEFCQAYAPDRRQVGRSPYYNEHSETLWELAEAADQDYAVISHHVARPTGLSASSPGSTTWLSTRAPDALFAACLMEAEHLLKADDRYADYQQKYEQDLLPKARLELRNLIRQGDRGPFQGVASAA